MRRVVEMSSKSFGSCHKLTAAALGRQDKTGGCTTVRSSGQQTKSATDEWRQTDRATANWAIHFDQLGDNIEGWLRM